MANNSDEIEVVFKATTNKKSAEKTGSELVNTVQDTVDKKGGIELDLKLAKKPIKGLEKEQKKILNSWKKVSKQGGLLSAPKEDITEYIDLLMNFLKLAGQAHKGNSDAYQELKRVLTNYQEMFSEKNIAKASAKWKRDADAKREAKKQARENEKINAKYYKTLRKGSSRAEAGTPGAKTKLGTRSSNMDSTYFGLETTHPKTGRKDKPILRLNDMVGTYFGKNSLMRRYTRNR